MENVKVTKAQTMPTQEKKYRPEKKTDVIPNKAYDLEYSTQYKKEVIFLANCGFRYTFVKRNEYGVKTYKYAKTPELFRAISVFYQDERNNKQFEKYREMVKVTDTQSELMADVIKEITGE